MLFSTPLDGQWSFALDPEGRGEAEAWFRAKLSDTIHLPGSVDEARKTPLTIGGTMAHLSRRHPYVGKAWYARDFEVEPQADGFFHHLALERPHGEVNVWIDGLKLGRDESLSTENRFLIGPLAAGRHRLVMMIDNSRFEAVGDAIARNGPKMADVAHSKTEHTQTNWNGVVGYLRIEAARASVARVDVFAPDHKARVHVELDAFDPDNRWPTYWTEPHLDELKLSFTFGDGTAPLELTYPVTIDSGYTPADFDIELPSEARRWDEFDPVVHHLTVEWLRDGAPQDRRTVSFGIRSFRREGRRLTLNGRPVFLRGTLDCCIFPLTGYPPTNHEGWRKVFGTAKAYGLNHIRYHSYCPPRAAFEVADEMGMLLHVETPVWPVLGSDPHLDRYIHSEAERIVRDYGNHPSFVMLCVGNELNGPGLHAFIERFVDEWKARDDRRVYTGGSGWPTMKRADYISKPEPRNQRWGEGLAGRLNARPLETLTDWSDWRDSVPVPLVSHETGQWCVYPNLEEIGKYTGVLEARNFIMVRDDLAAKGLLPLARDYMLASGALQTQLYKEEMEAAFRTRDFPGTQLLGLQDFPGQGTALVGVVNAFWDEKPYVTPERFREFCAPVVPLVRAKGFVFTAGDAVEMDVQLAQFGPDKLAEASLNWEVRDQSGAVQRSGRFDVSGLVTGHLHDVGTLRFDATSLPAPARYELVLFLPGTDYRNRWDFWVFEAAEAGALPAAVDRLDAGALARLEAGETLLFMPRPEALKPNAVLGHTCAFWNTLWTDGQEPHTLGLLNDTGHPIFAHFPSETHSNWHWFELTLGRRAFDIAGVGFEPIVRVVDDWNENRDLVLLAEAEVGKGRLLISAMDVDSDLDSRPVARSLRNALAAYAARPNAVAPRLDARQLTQWLERISA